jgi:hypothetical protein
MVHDTEPFNLWPMCNYETAIKSSNGDLIRLPAFDIPEYPLASRYISCSTFCDTPGWVSQDIKGLCYQFCTHFMRVTQFVGSRERYHFQLPMHVNEDDTPTGSVYIIARSFKQCAISGALREEVPDVPRDCAHSMSRGFHTSTYWECFCLECQYPLAPYEIINW